MTDANLFEAQVIGSLYLVQSLLQLWRLVTDPFSYCGVRCYLMCNSGNSFAFTHLNLSAAFFSISFA
jgi:hypothetical protein